MYTEADLYDVMSDAMGKGFAGQAGQVADLVRRARPHSGTLLDVACGTGEHAQCLRKPEVERARPVCHPKSLAVRCSKVTCPGVPSMVPVSH